MESSDADTGESEEKIKGLKPALFLEIIRKCQTEGKTVTLHKSALEKRSIFIAKMIQAEILTFHFLEFEIKLTWYLVP